MTYDEHAYEAEKVAYNRSWNDIDLDPTFENRRENRLVRRKSGNRLREYEDTQFGDPQHIEFDTDDLIEAAVDVYLNQGNPLRRALPMGRICTLPGGHAASGDFKCALSQRLQRGA
jgi:hypothetical protein